MLIYIGSDHKGFELKEDLKKFLKNKGYEVIDVGNGSYDKNDDYPDFSSLVGRAVSHDSINRKGILICGSGVGVDIVANKFKDVRSVLAINPEQVRLSRNDDDTNVISLPAEFINNVAAVEILETWLNTPFSGEERHKRRLEKIKEIEEYK